nr:hypothetical protein [Candidatus Woesearchaeota archaeon]
MINKRGALELSINTIVIVVIGITLLTLGLVFVRGIFGKLNELSDNTFGTAEAQIGRLGQGDARLVTPSVVTVKQGQTVKQNIIVGNDGDTGQFRVELKRIISSGSPPETQVAAKMVLTSATTTYSVNLNSGDSITIPIVIAAVSDAPLTTGLNSVQYAVEVKKDNQPYENGAFIINVEKGSGLFG